MKEKLRAMLWTTAWPHLFKKATGEKIDARRAAFNAQVSDDIRLAMDVKFFSEQLTDLLYQLIECERLVQNCDN